jgi:hypothetical protein
VAKPLDTRKDSARSGGESRQQESKSAHAVGGHQSSGATPHSSSSPAVERDPARDSALARAMQQIEKQYGKGAVMRMDGQNIQPIEGIETGSLGLDIALGGVGVPRGRVLEIFGPESSGKTTLTLHIVANAQKNGGVAAFIDAEHALDPSPGASGWGCSWKICSSRSRIPANRPWKFARCWCAPTRWT